MAGRWDADRPGRTISESADSRQPGANRPIHDRPERAGGDCWGRPGSGGPVGCTRRKGAAGGQRGAEWPGPPCGGYRDRPGSVRRRRGDRRAYRRFRRGSHGHPRLWRRSPASQAGRCGRRTGGLVWPGLRRLGISDRGAGQRGPHQLQILWRRRTG